MNGDKHVIFVWTPHGYELQERDGPPPEVGSTVEVGDGVQRVGKVGPSPLPGDSRPCVYLQG